MFRVGIIGDSSSSVIGAGEVCWPSRLWARFNRDDLAATVVNGAVPGFTSYDAVPFCRDMLKKVKPNWVIIYLGNNEGCRSSRKGRAPWFRWPWPRRRHGAALQPMPLLQKFAWREDYPPISVATTPADFASNLRRMVSMAGRSGAKVLLINPIANRRFPSGVGGANALYLIYPDWTIDGRDLPGSERDDVCALIRSLRLYHEGKAGDALASLPPPASLSLDVGWVASCHRAVCLASLSRERDALNALPSREDTPPRYQPMRTYLEACLSGEKGGYAAAYEQDYSLYRVKRAYRDVVTSIAKDSGCGFLDLEDLLEPRHFVDYCHPDADGHQIISDAVWSILDPAERGNKGPAVLESELISPNYGKSPHEDLVDYYQMDYPLDTRQIEALFSRPASARGEGGASDEILLGYRDHFLASNKNHPAFTPSLDLAGIHRPLSHEILTFPEFYLYRMLGSVFMEAKAHEWFRSWRQKKNGEPILLEPEMYNRLILRHNRDSLAWPGFLDRETTLGEIVSRMCSPPREIFEDRRAWRIRTVTYWYTRESFRYGTHSRPSMLYERWALDRQIEGAAVGLALARACSNGLAIDRLTQTIDLLAGLVSCHEKFCREWPAGDCCQDDRYNSELTQHRSAYHNLYCVKAYPDEKTNP